MSNSSTRTTCRTRQSENRTIALRTCCMRTLVAVLLLGISSVDGAAVAGSQEGPAIFSTLDARHVSLNAIRVSWRDPDEDNHTTLVSRVYNVAVAKKNCSQHEQVYRLEGKQEWTFWNLTPGRAYFVCVQDVATDGTTSAWVFTKVESRVVRPPSIVKSPEDALFVYYPDEEILLPCRAAGLPPPTVRWTRDQNVLEDGDLGVRVDNGQLVIAKADKQHEGSYMCVAQNEAGRAQSRAVLLQMAVLHPFPPDEQPKTFSVTPGDSQKLECRFSYSLPPAGFSWSRVNGMTDPRPRPVKQDHRVFIAQDGTLLFAYTMKSDAGMYRCEAHNHVTDDVVVGSFSTLEVKGEEDYSFPPQLLYRSPSDHQVAIVGSHAIMKCVFGGRPVPTVIWQRDGALPRDRHHLTDDNTTLVIDAVRVTDQGKYSCQGRNSAGPSHAFNFQLIVNAAPVWDRRPASVNATVGDNVTLHCRAEGIPAPRVQWLANGLPLSQGGLDTLTVSGSALTLHNVTKRDIMNIQCNASNIHGYVYADAYVNVLEPTVIVRPPEDQVLRDYGIMKFPCEVTSDPGTLLTVTWWRGETPVVADPPRIYISAAGSLVINATVEQDGGDSFLATYTCRAENGVDEVEARAHLQPPLTSPDVLVPQPIMKHTGMSFKELLWIGIASGLGGLVMVCLVLVLLLRKRSSPLVRSSTDNSILTYLSAASRGDDDHNSKYWLGYEQPGVGGGFGGGSPLSEDTIKDTIQEVYIPRSRIELGSLVGKGQFGRVYSASLKDYRGKATTKVAVKTLKYRAEETDMVDLFLREAILMKDFRHPHVLSLIGISFEQDASPMVVLPFMANGDLRKYIQEPKRDITVLELLKLGLQVARGMNYLSNMRFVHRDLAARNCMVDSHIVVKVADFGLSRDLYSRDYYRIEDGKTPLPIRWMAPECLEASVFTVKSDMWSYGVLLWELMTRGAVPYPDIDNWDIGTYVQGGKRLAQPHYCPDSVYDIMQMCWATLPEERPTFAEVVGRVEAVVNSAKCVDCSASHFYLNIHALTAISDYREVAL